MNNKRTEILDIAEALIQRVGVNAMSYKDISDAVGIRKASIHHHFPKKEDLINGLLERCHISYGDNYKRIVTGTETAPEKLRKIAEVFKEGLQKGQICLVGAIGSDKSTLQANTCVILEETIRNTTEIYSLAFRQGREEGTLSFTGTDDEAAYSFFSFLLGAQIAARAYGGVESFCSSTEVIITSLEK